MPGWISAPLIYQLAVTGHRWHHKNSTQVLCTGFGWLRNDELLLNLLHPETAPNGNLMGTGNKAVSLGNREVKSKPNQTRKEVRISQSLWEKVLRHQTAPKAKPVCHVRWGRKPTLFLCGNICRVFLLCGLTKEIYLTLTAPITAPDFVSLD